MCRVAEAYKASGLREHDRDVLSACWPAVLRMASAAFVARVRGTFPLGTQRRVLRSPIPASEEKPTKACR